MALLTPVFALLVLGVFASGAEEIETDNYIIGGATARPNQFPFLVSLRTLKNIHFCGAGIISDRWLLSAASCTQGIYSDSQNVLAVIGAHHRKTDGRTFKIELILNHQQYNPQNNFNDISVLQTAEKIAFVSGRVQPLRLPTENFNDAVQPRTRLWIAGWGLTNVCLF